MSAAGNPSLLRSMRTPLFLTLVILVASFFWRGLDFTETVAILAVLEFVFSFDNAVVNSKILIRMSRGWQIAFLTLGILVAVFLMRFAFPIIVVVATAGLSPWEAWSLALNNPAQYAADLDAAHPAIAALGGIFLLMIFLDWLFDDRELYWLPGERLLARLGKEDIVSSVLGLGALFVVSRYFAGDHGTEVLVFGIIGWIAYQIVNLIGKITESQAEKESADEGDLRLGKTLKRVAGAAGVGLFLKLELIDASFSFDGVSGAFAISSDIFAIMIGLGIGALYIRSLTVYLTNSGTLGEYVYLEHGAHWAIGALAVVLFATMQHELPEWLTGSIGLFLIAAAFVHSLVRRRQLGSDNDEANPAVLNTPETV